MIIATGDRRSADSYLNVSKIPVSISRHPSEYAEVLNPQSSAPEAALTAFAALHPPRLRYLVAVSGGCDSVALLDLLHHAGYRNLVVCHLNHGLRGRESGQDATFVGRLAKKYGTDFETEKAEVARIASDRKISLEEAGRRARLEFFARVSKKRRCRKIILGHHADDQVETVLMHLCRGTGGGGLGGIRPESEISVPSKGSKPAPLLLLRPLLGVRRDDLRTHLDSNQLTYREDRTNTNTAHLRNRVRHQLLPELDSTFGRDVTSALLRAATVSADEDAHLGSLAADAYIAATADAPVSGLPSSSPAPLQPTLRTDRLRAQPIALQRRVLHHWLTVLGVPDIGFREIEAVRALLEEPAASAKTNLPGAHHARRKSGRLFVTPPSS